MKLTRAERAVARHLLRGFTSVNIAAVLGISEHTAKCHIKSILKKTGARSCGQFALKAIRSEALLREVMEVG
jgi:DNA-binding CsgD family transcriptional regulator